LMSRQLAAGEAAAALESQNRAMELCLLLTLPATAALMAIAHPIIAVIYQHGSFTAADTAAVAPALMLLAAGLPAYVLVKVLTPGFFARHDTRTPVRIAGLSMVLNVVMNLALAGPLSYLGMALSTAVSAWLNVILLAISLKRRGIFAMDARLLNRLPRIVLASALMAGALLAAQYFGASLMSAPGLRYAWVAALVALGLVTYAIAAPLTGAAHLGELKAMLQRSGAGKTAKVKS